MEILFFVSGFLAFGSFLSYVYKFCVRKDYAYIGMMFSRIFLVVMWLAHFIGNEHISRDDFLVVVSILMVAEVVNSVVFFASKRHIANIQKTSTALELVQEDSYIKKILSQEVGFFIVSQEGNLKYFNSTLLDILGYKKEELKDKNILSLVYPDDIELVSREFSSKVTGDKTSSASDFRIITKDGTVKKVKVLSSVITNGHTSVTGSVFVKED